MFQRLVEKAKQLLDPVGPVEERRDVIRLSCRIGIHYAPDGAGNRDGIVSNLSLKGLRLETNEKLKKGDRMLITLPNSRFGGVRCVVMWSRVAGTGGNYSNGLKYDDTQENLAASWLKDSLKQLGFESGKIRERRNFIRFPTPHEVRVTIATRQGEEMSEGRVLNLGMGGALVGIYVQIPPGTLVRLQLGPTLDTPPLDALASVRSCAKDVKKQLYVTGLQFEIPGEPQIKRFIRAIKRKLSRG